MDFFEQIGRKITNAGQNVAQQTKNFADISQVNSIISENQKKISQSLLELGEMYYGSHKDDSSAEFYEIITEINKLYFEIEQKQEKIKQIKGVVKCPQCGADVVPNAAFCNVCGSKIKRETAEAAKDESQIYCPVCQAVVDPADSFCNHCGTKLKKL